MEFPKRVPKCICIYLYSQIGWKISWIIGDYNRGVLKLRSKGWFRELKTKMLEVFKVLKIQVAIASRFLSWFWVGINEEKAHWFIKKTKNGTERDIILVFCSSL